MAHEKSINNFALPKTGNIKTLLSFPPVAVLSVSGGSLGTPLI